MAAASASTRRGCSHTCRPASKAAAAVSVSRPMSVPKRLTEVQCSSSRIAVRSRRTMAAGKVARDKLPPA